ncbi:MAG: DMT family transporter [Acidobacteria bacterium]|nr:DMT family transporter [Acidobacteriota bacterium]MBS1866519.1 DMT family transporter [Acidobacteriota bacterium]
MSSTAANRRSLAYLALVGGILCIAWSAIFVRWTDIPGPASAFYRLLIPALVLAPTWLLDRKTPRVNLRTLAIICGGGVFFALDLALYNTSILKTSAANATLLGNNTPIFVGLITWLIFRRRPSTAFWLGLALAVAGSLVIVWGDIAERAHLGWGDAMALAASACFAVYLLATEEVRGHTGTLVFLRLAILSSAAFLLVLNLAMRVPLGIPSGKSFAALVGLGLVSQLGGYFFLTYAMGHLPATVTSVSLLSQGPLTALLAAFLLHEPLTVPLLIGGSLVLLGIALANRLKRPEQEANAALCEAAEAAQGETGA